MAVEMAEPEEVDYDDDFEEASDDDGGMHKSLHGANRRDITSASRRQKLVVEVPAPISVPVECPVEIPSLPSPDPIRSASSRAVASPRPGSGRRPGRRRDGGEDVRPPVPVRSTTEDALEMNTSTGSFTNSTGRRPVRAKISVGGGNGDELIRGMSSDRPGTGDSTSSRVKQSSSARLGSGLTPPASIPLPPARSAVPIWLQGGGQSSGPRSLSGDRGLNPPASGSGAPARSADAFPGRGRPPIEPDFDDRGTADADRKLKRLQQEIQRLEGRLRETDMYSADEGLPVFTLEELDIGSQIGQGGFCSVHYCTWRSTACAVKKIFDPVITEELRSEFENEVRMLRRLRHPNVITIMAVCRVAPALSILTEFVAGGSLFELLHSPPKAKRSDLIDCEAASLLPVVEQIAAALAYLHAMLVAHRDVKSHNVLLTRGTHPVAKLCDFGLARTKSELCTGTMQWAGTACYMAPELFAKRKYTEAVDVFAFGVMLWETMSTEIPHANMEPCDIAHRVQNKDGAGLPVTHDWPKALKALLRTSLAVQAEDRPSMVSVREQLTKIIAEFPAPD